MHNIAFMKIKVIIKTIHYLAIALTSILCIGCGEKSNKKTLTLGCSADYPPFEFKIHGKVVGFAPDLANLICKKLGYSLEIKDMDFSGLIAALNSSRIDFIMSSMTITEERMKRLDFSQTYYQPKLAVIYRKDNNVDTVQKMIGKKIGVQLGTTMEIFVKKKAKELGDIHILSLNRNPELIQELKIGRIDGIVIEQSQVEHFAKANADLTYSILTDNAGEGYAIAFPKGSDLKEKFNIALNEIKESGELEAILKKWSL